MTSALENVHWVTIKVKQTHQATIEDYLLILKWDNLPWAVRTKWNWYFRYRAALAQVHHPRCIVEFSWGNQPAQGKQLKQIRKERLSRAKAAVTKIKNQLAGAVREWNSLFPIEEDNAYKKAIAKMERKIADLERAQQLYDEVKDEK